MIAIRIPGALYKKIRNDLSRPHCYAAERIGFAYATHATTGADSVVTLQRYVPVDDGDYVHDYRVGARINSQAIRAALQGILDSKDGCFHVHHHPHRGSTGLSRTDAAGIPPIVESFARIGPQLAHGILILTDDCATAFVWLPSSSRPILVPRVQVVGAYPSGAHHRRRS